VHLFHVFYKLSALGWKFNFRNCPKLDQNFYLISSIRKLKPQTIKALSIERITFLLDDRLGLGSSSSSSRLEFCQESHICPSNRMLIASNLKVTAIAVERQQQASKQASKHKQN